VEYEMGPKNLSRPFTAIYKPENKSEEFNAKFEDFINKTNLKDFVKIGVKEITDPRIDNPKFGAAPKEFASLRAKLGDESLLDKIQMINVNILRDLLDELDSYNLEESSTYNEYSEVGYKKVGELNEAYVPSNIAEFAKRKGVMALVNTVAGWAEKVGKRIVGGTAIGKNYDTLILDMTYQGSEIRINTEYETIELYDEPVRTFTQFKSVYEENQEEESVNEGMGGQLDEKYFIEVSVRDARKAINIFNDQYSKSDIEMYGSNVYASNTISDIYDLYYDLTSQNIEILDYDIDESDFDDESDDLEEVTNEFSPISYAMKVINGKKIEDVMKESGLRFVELKSLIDKIQKGLVPSMNEEQYGRSKLQKGFEDAISKETFSKLKGKKVGYFGNTYKVIDSDEYIITLQDDDGDIKTVNLNQFIQKGIIPELKKRIQETIKLGEGMIEEELCAKGKAYRKRRLAAGEKSSAYLSGRAVKVCKGQMSGKKKKVNEESDARKSAIQAFQKMPIGKVVKTTKGDFKKIEADKFENTSTKVKYNSAQMSYTTPSTK